MNARTHRVSSSSTPLLVALCLFSLATLSACPDDGEDNPDPDATIADTDAQADAGDVGDVLQDVDAADTSPPAASVQIIYEVPEPAASEVDIFINEELAADNIQYQTATPYFDVRADQELTFQVATREAAEQGSEDTTLEPGEPTFGDPMTATFEPDSTNQIVVHGVANTQDYSTGDLDVSRDISLSMGINRDARTEPTNLEGETEVNAFHATIDAPEFDLVPDNLESPSHSGVDYGEFSSDYVNFQEGRHVFDVTGAGNLEQILQTFQSEQYTSEAVLTFVASGFRSPDNAPGNSSTFRLVAYPPQPDDGNDLIQGRVLQRAARAQFIHASPDPAFSTIDVFLDERRRLDEFTFRDATAFQTIASGISYTLSVTDPAASDNEDTLVSPQDITFDPGSSQVVVATGVNDPGEWEGDFDDLGFRFRTGRAVNAVPTNLNDDPQAALQFFHGSNDAGTLRPEISIPDSEDPRRFATLNYTEFLSDVRGNGRPPFVNATDRLLTVRNDAGTALGTSYNLPLSEDQYAGRNTTVILTGVLTSDGDPPDARPYELFVVTETGDAFEPAPAN